jgi:hypothetical protein
MFLVKQRQFINHTVCAFRGRTAHYTKWVTIGRYDTQDQAAAFRTEKSRVGLQQTIVTLRGRTVVDAQGREAQMAATKTQLLTLAKQHNVRVVWADGDGHDNPDIELLAPDGLWFKYNETHSLLCFGFSDAYSRLAQEAHGIVPCRCPRCDCGWDMTQEREVR